MLKAVQEHPTDRAQRAGKLRAGRRGSGPQPANTNGAPRECAPAAVLGGSEEELLDWDLAVESPPLGPAEAVSFRIFEAGYRSACLREDPLE